MIALILIAHGVLLLTRKKMEFAKRADDHIQALDGCNQRRK